MKSFVCSLVLISLMTGCVGSKVWIRDSTDAEQAKRDFFECKYDSSKNSFVAYGRHIDPVSAGIQEGFQSVNLMNQCMTAKGYYLVGKHELERKKAEHEKQVKDYSMAIQNKDYEKAINLMNKLILDNPNSFGPYQGRGNAYFLLKKYNEAISDYNKAISLGCQEVEIYAWKSLSFAEIGEYDIALEVANQAIQDRSDANLYNARAYILNKKEKYDDALEDCNKAISLDNKRPNFYKNKGVAYFGKGQHDKAMEQFNKAISINPEYSYAYSERGKLFAKLNKNENAINDYKKACEYGDKDSCERIK